MKLREMLGLAVASVFGAPVLYALVWIAASVVGPGEVGFGYYGSFNKAKHAIQRTHCFESLRYSQHHDLTLENFHFRLSTKCGRIVLLFFDEEMDIDQVCTRPKGILISSPWHLDGDQCYVIDPVHGRLSQTEIHVRDINDLLCNLDEFIAVFERNYRNETIPILSYKDEDFSKCLQIRIMGIGEREFYIYPGQS